MFVLVNKKASIWILTSGVSFGANDFMAQPQVSAVVIMEPLPLYYCDSDS